MVPEHLIEKALWAAQKHLSALDDDSGIESLGVTWGDTPVEVTAYGEIHLRPVMVAALGAVAADIWDEGYEAGRDEDDGGGRLHPNPYETGA